MIKSTMAILTSLSILIGVYGNLMAGDEAVDCTIFNLNDTPRSICTLKEVMPGNGVRLKDVKTGYEENFQVDKIDAGIKIGNRVKLIWNPGYPSRLMKADKTGVADSAAQASAGAPQPGQSMTIPKGGKKTAREAALMKVLASKEWQFIHPDGSVIADRIRLITGGRIEGYTNPNESIWDVKGDFLYFFDENGKPSIIFKSAKQINGKWVLSGPVVLSGGTQIRVLKEL